MKRTCLVTLLLAFTGLSVLGAPPNQDSGSRQKKDPWEWTDSERIAARFDSAFIKANSHPPGHAPAGYVAAEGVRGDLVLVIDGSKTPEAFLPFELFNSLLGGLHADVAYQQQRRAMLRSGIVGSGYKDPDAFWAEFARVVQPHLVLLEKSAALDDRIQRAGATERGALQKQRHELDISVCRSRFRALTAARAHYGQANFDRFLYTVVAPDLKTIGSLPDSDAESLLTYSAGGCQ